MKVLSLTQPWATLVAIGAKTVETRSWKTNYSGPLAIHAAVGFPRWAKEFSKDVELSVLFGTDYDFPRGEIVCVTSLQYCVPTSSVRDKLSNQEIRFGDYSDGRWAWKLGPILKCYRKAEYPAKGHLGLWECEWAGDHPA